jgi:hypothetical protein
MLKKIINLRKEKKRRKNLEKELIAQTNRLKFGKTKTQKTIDKANKKKLDKVFSGRRLSDLD